MEKVKKSKKNAWDNNASPYGTYEGVAGNSEMWKNAFDTVYPRAKALGILKETNLEAHVILGIAMDASEDEIKKAYRKLAIIHHPDKGGKQTDFERITAAYSIMLG